MRRMVFALIQGALLTLGSSPCWAGFVSELESNNSLATAQDVNGYFTLDYQIASGDGGTVANTSTTIPHVTVTGSGNGTFDYYSFYSPGTSGGTGQIILDIDYTSSSLDSLIGLWADDGTFLGWNDDYDKFAGAAGSIRDQDSLMSTYVTTPGTYIVGVARWNATVGTGGLTGGYPDAELESTDLYTLQISVVGQLPEPSSMALALVGLICVGYKARRTRKLMTTRPP